MPPIYHITSIHNLPNILQNGGLWCDRIVQQRSLAQVSIAHRHIKERRAQKPVPCGPGGFVADYVPFYFAPRSPMLYTISRGNVEGYTAGQSPILHLVSSTEVVLAAGLAFVFTDGHAEMDISRFYTNLQDLDRIDWDVMRATYWNDTREDGDRKRRRQAEFLVHQFSPFSMFTTIVVLNRTIAAQVAALLNPLERKPEIQILPAWYY